jgi:hypothetical protein
VETVVIREKDPMNIRVFLEGFMKAARDRAKRAA